MAFVPVTDFISKLPLQLRETHNIQPLKNVGAICWVSNKLDIQLPSFPEELKGKVRGVAIEENDPRTAGCLFTGGRVKILTSQFNAMRLFVQPFSELANLVCVRFILI